MSRPRKTHEVLWAEVAVLDLATIVGFLKDRDPDLARRTIELIARKAAALVTFPMRGRVVPELQAHDITTHRELIVGCYRVLYRIDGSRVLVVAVIDSRRDLESALLARLLQM